MIRLVVFDLDGTLIDSRRDLADATNATLVEYGGAPLEVDRVSGMVGEGAAVLVRRAFEAAGLPPDAPGALDAFLDHYSRRLTTHTRLYPGFPATLEALARARVKLAVLTNKPQRHTGAILDRLGIAAWFSEVVGGDTAAGRKPDPAGLLGIVRRLGESPPSTLLVGDSRVDLETARRAAVRICLARYGFGFRFDEGAFQGSERFIDRPQELLPLVTSGG